MLSARAYLETGYSSFLSWLESHTQSTSPRRIPASDGGYWKLEPARALDFLEGDPDGPRGVIEARLVPPLEEGIEAKEHERPAKAIMFKEQELTETRSAVWIECRIHDLDAYCSEILLEIERAWPSADLEVTSGRLIVPPSANAEEILTMDTALRVRLREEWGGLFQRRLMVASQRRQNVPIATIADQEGVGRRTIKRDIAALKKEGLIR